MAADGVELPAPRGLLRVLDDVWNPILVKEVRQALRGKYFRICFVVTLAAVTIVGAAAIVNMGRTVSHSEGRDFFWAIYVCLSIAVLGLVPFSAFNAMGAEWDENTYDLLIISNLRPKGIVLGKLLSSLVQALLYYSAFTPFLVFSFLLRGIDLLVVAFLLAVSLLMSVGLSLLAIALSTLSRVKFARVVLMAVLSGALVGMIGVAAGLSQEFLRRPGTLRTGDFVNGMVGFGLGIAAVAAFCGVLAANMLSHSEENRSTGMRVLSAMTVVTGMGFVTYMMAVHPDRDALSGVSVAFLGFMLLPMTFFTTEPEALSRRVAPRVPRRRLLALLATPFLPGGGRGMLLHLLSTAAVLAFSTFMHFAYASSHAVLDEGMLSVFAAALYTTVYVGLPSAIGSGYSTRPMMRIVVRLAIPAVILSAAYLPALYGFFADDRSFVRMRHAGNPFFLIDKMWGGAIGAQRQVTILMVGLATVALALNARRMFAGVREVLSASSRRAAAVPRPRGSEPETGGGSGGAVAES